MSGANGADRLILPGDVAGERPQQAQDKAVVEQMAQPLFEIVVRSRLATERPLHHFKIYPNGNVEGFDALGGAEVVVHNHVPELYIGVAEPIFEVANALQLVIQYLMAGSLVQEKANAPHG